MATIILSSIGSSVGNALLPGLGGRIVSAFGRRAGRAIDRGLGLDPSKALKDGPRLENLRVQDSRYGAGIPVAFGRVRVAGNVVWGSALIETAHETQVGGGKGGGVFGGASRTTYSYSMHCAVAICAGSIGGVQTIWADGKVIFQNGAWRDGVVGGATLYRGTLTQNADPLMQSLIAGDVPAYRGTAYIVLESLQLGKFGNRLPNLTFEVLPEAGDAQPSWLGVADAGISNHAAALRNKGMPPIAIEGSSVSARRLIVGGYKVTGANATFDVVEYDVTGDAPVQLAHSVSAAFSVETVGAHSWALAPDGRYVALCGLNTGASPSHRLALYDVENRQFGAIFSVNLPFSTATKQVAWIDAQRFVITDAVAGKRGLRVFARAGLGIVDLGFFDVWGAGSTATTAPLYFAQFTPMAGGLLHYMADVSPMFTTLYARSVVWQGNGLVVGGQYTVVSGLTTGVGSDAQISLLPTGEGEWTLFYGTTIDMRMLSFCPDLNAATITRPWQTLVSANVGVTTSVHPVVYGDRIVVAQRDDSENFYRLSEIALGSGGFSLAVDGAPVSGFSLPANDFAAAAVDGARLLLLGLKGFDSKLAQVAIVQRRHTGDTLDNVVANILQRAGYGGGDYDVSALADVPVDGYVLQGPMEAADALEPLQIYEPFDLVESGTQLKAVRHGNVATVTIDASEGRATDKELTEPLPSRTQTRAQEIDLPVEVAVDYLDASLDYQVGSQRARRLATRGARAMAKLALPIVCSAAKAKRIAEARLYAAWGERDHVALRWSRRWLGVEPADVVDLGDRLMRVASVRLMGGVLAVEGALVPAVAAASAAVADAGTAAAHSDIKPLGSVLYVMDMPLLRAEDDQPGVYVAVGGQSGWTGASLWRAADGVSYSRVAGFDTAAVCGIAATALADGSPHYLDRAGTVRVQLLQGTLASCTEAALLNGANVARLGTEILQFRTATLVGQGLYELSDLLRGRRGTESATASHGVGEAFVLLTTGAVQFLPALLTDRGRAYGFRALSNGQTLGDAIDTSFTYGLLTLQPLAPTHVVASRVAGVGSDLSLSWKRRARRNGDWIDYVDVPLDELAELYDVEIMNGGTVVRSFNGLTAPTLTYTAAQQSADWGAVPALFTVRVYQISARYGRGQRAVAVV